MVVRSPDLMNDISMYDKNQDAPTRDSVNKAIDDINILFHKESTERHNADKWFNQELDTIRKYLRKISNEKHHQPNNPALSFRYKDILS